MKQFILILMLFVCVSNNVFSKEINVRTDNSKIAEDKIIREVMPNETKEDIANEFGITVAELERQNPAIVNELEVGFILTIEKPTLEIKENINIKESFNMFVNEVISVASKNIGTRYRSGGTSTTGFDCSGLMYATFENFEITLPRSSIKQSEFGTKINIESAQKGDLIFFQTGKRNKINHVGMIVEVVDGEIKFIHSSVQNGVIISSTKESYYENRIVQVNRIL